MNRYYIMIHAYKDGAFVYREKTDDIKKALNAAAIYLEDPTCNNIKIWDNEGTSILTYWRDAQ